MAWNLLTRLELNSDTHHQRSTPTRTISQTRPVPDNNVHNWKFMAVKSPSLTLACTKTSECETVLATHTHTQKHNQNCLVLSRRLPGSSLTHSPECVEEGSATLRSASGSFPDTLCVCGTCWLNIHLTNTHLPLSKQWRRKECPIDGFLYKCAFFKIYSHHSRRLF